ncbi:MAG: hypothetical protein KJ970_02900 [Candidatus Eisenbacteria bacterium]|uniref:Cytochrome c-552/DMSO reductase-like haem-binding domain-containing protein n=1 Tax=Eiseniibacteriota bacterium TaxID=2212470 RepID=A0A948RUC4_UNCEI|nr:hypothetical protein [Candidatus Eisenbacteria bacterium]MBU1949789.1 hypothetical protein [Candidatus Eisenbacteria bacterium]MBU2689849.1 hypothetical protein [Candidatus Eisenbacteria bacterium]
MNTPYIGSKPRESAIPQGLRRKVFNWIPRLVGLGIIISLMVFSACEEDLPPAPDETITNVIPVLYLTQEDLEQNHIELNGEAIDQEWGGPLQPGREFHQIRLSAENGAGDPGPPIYVSLKAIYTDDDLFLLVRWPDRSLNTQKDFMMYAGPDLPRRELYCTPEYWDTTVVRDTVYQPLPGYDEFVDCPGGGQECDTFWVREVITIDYCDTLVIEGCQADLADPNNWIQFGDEDRFSIAFQMRPTGDMKGTYDKQGCLVACHQNESPSFGRPSYGRLDIWQWLASRTDPIRDLYTPTDNPNYPRFGTPGYLEDMVAEPTTGLIPDPGLGAYTPNFEEGSPIPKWVYRCEDDPFCEPIDPDRCLSEFGERCRINNGLALTYLWRESRQFERYAIFSACDTINEAPLPLGTDIRFWRYGDTVPGWILTYPEDSRADIHGSGQWDEGVWTLEIARKLQTQDPNNDFQFLAQEGFEVTFTLALMNNSGTAHWGSEPQILRFNPRD